MIRSRNWTAIERLPDGPGVVKLTSTGYVKDGVHVRTVGRPSPMPQPRRGLVALFGRG